MCNFLYHIHTLTEDFLRKGKLYRQSSANIRQKTPWELSVGKCPVPELSGCRPRPGCRRSETRPRSSREWPYRFNTFSTENEIINKEFVVASMASAQKRNVGMDV